MGHPSPDQIADIVLNRRQVYDLDTDSHIRQAASRLTTRAMFELLKRLDDKSPNFANDLSVLLSKFDGGEASVLIGFDTGELPTADAPRQEFRTILGHASITSSSSSATSRLRIINSLSFPT